MTFPVPAPAIIVGRWLDDAVPKGMRNRSQGWQV